MKNYMVSLLALLAICITSCKKKNVDNSGKSHARLKNIYINYDGVPRSSPVAGYAVHFTSDAYGASGYKWDFGDGNSSAEAYPDHVYAKEGTYTVVLKLDNDNLVTADTSVAVAKVPTITATFAGKYSCHVYNYSHVADHDKRDTGYSDIEIKCVDPVTISFDSYKFYFQSSVVSGAVTVVSYRWFNGNLGANNEYDMTIVRMPSKDSFYCTESGAPSLGEYYSTTYVSP